MRTGTGNWGDLGFSVADSFSFDISENFGRFIPRGLLTFFELDSIIFRFEILCFFSGSDFWGDFLFDKEKFGIFCPDWCRRRPLNAVAIRKKIPSAFHSAQFFWKLFQFYSQKREYLDTQCENIEKNSMIH